MVFSRGTGGTRLDEVAFFLFEWFCRWSGNLGFIEKMANFPNFLGLLLAKKQARVVLFDGFDICVLGVKLVEK